MDRETGRCTGCQRTLAEIASWASLTEAEKTAILAVLPERWQEA